MASQSSLEDRTSAGRYYMNKIFGRGVERARALEHSGRGASPLGPARRITIEPQSGGGHRIVVERSAAVEENAHPDATNGRGAIGDSPTSEHSFAGTDDAIRFLSDVLNDRPPAEPSGGSDADRFLDQVLAENGASRD